LSENIVFYVFSAFISNTFACLGSLPVCEVLY